MRLTLAYGLLFLAAGTVLLTLNYFLVRHSLGSRPSEVRAAVARRLGVPTQALSPDRRLLPPRHVAGSDGAPLFRDAQREFVNESLHRLLVQSGIALGVMAVGSVALGWYMSGRALRPVKNMTATARRLSEENLHERIALPGPHDELTELADTFDDMIARLDAAFDAQKRFVADASHELRTPLSVIRTEVDVTLADPEATRHELRSMGEAVRESAVRTGILIESLLTLARSDSAVVRSERVDLASVTTAAVERSAREFEHLELGLDLDLQPAVVTGDPALLEHAVNNLVDNAFRYNRSAGFVAISTRTDGATVVFRITNTGPLVAENEVGRLTERFHRGSRTNHDGVTGFGLGLSIVDAVCKRHTATLTIAARPEGGLEISMAFPAAEASQPTAAPVEIGVARAR